MMRAEIALGLICIAGAIVGVRYVDRAHPVAGHSQTASANSLVAKASEDASYSAYRAGWNREVRIAAGYDRQFRITAAVNNQPMSFLIDTGASFVALRESDARRAGVRLKPEDYKSAVSTANGITKAARVTIDEIEIEGLHVRNIDTFILPDEKLGMNLLGMSFLSQLKSVEARGQELILRG